MRRAGPRAGGGAQARRTVVVLSLGRSPGGGPRGPSLSAPCGDQWSRAVGGVPALAALVSSFFAVRAECPHCRGQLGSGPQGGGGRFWKGRSGVTLRGAGRSAGVGWGAGRSQVVSHTRDESPRSGGEEPGPSQDLEEQGTGAGGCRSTPEFRIRPCRASLPYAFSHPEPHVLKAWPPPSPHPQL